MPPNVFRLPINSSCLRLLVSAWKSARIWRLLASQTFHLSSLLPCQYVCRLHRPHSFLVDECVARILISGAKLGLIKYAFHDRVGSQLARMASFEKISNFTFEVGSSYPNWTPAKICQQQKL